MDPNELQEAQKSILKSPEISEKVVCPTCGVKVGANISICPNDKTVLGTSLESTIQLPTRYEVIEEIGAGGMGVIYKARHLSLGILVAIKMLTTSKLDQAAMLRFEQEAKALSRLEHPNIVSIRDYGVTATGQPYMVLDYIDALTLEQHLAWNGPCSEAECLDIFLMAAEALAHAHERGVLHRDIKPSNIMVLKEDEALSIKIVDFGIAKVIDPSLAEKPQVTKTGEILGSPAYMSPEQALGKPLDQRSDIYSLACVMYESLTGAPPFTGSTPISILTSVINESPLPLRESMLGKAVSANLEQIIQKALSKDPDARFQTMSELESVLKITKSGNDLPAVAPTAAEIAYQTKRRKEQLLWRLCLALFLGLVVGGICWINVREKVARNKVSMPSCMVEVSDDEARDFIKREAAKKTEIILNVGTRDQSLSGFDTVHNTESIVMRYADVEGGGLAHLIHLPLKKLDLKYSEVRDAACSEIHSMKNLQHLCLANTRISDVGVEKLSGLKALTLLDLSSDDLTSQSIFNLHRLPHLRVLYFPGNSLSAEGAAELGKFPELEEFYLTNSLLEKGVIENLKGCKKLKLLDITNKNVTAAQLRSLAAVPQLQQLVLPGCSSLDGLDCSIFRRFPHLIMLDLGEIKVSDSSLAKLKGSQINEIKLYGSEISGKGLEALVDNKRLKKVDVRDCANLTVRDVEAFKRKRPDCRVIVR